MICDEINTEIKQYKALNERFEKEFNEYVAANNLQEEVKNNFLHTLETLIDEFAEQNIDITQYITRNNYNKYRLFDSKLTTLLYLIKNYDLDSAIAQNTLNKLCDISDESFEKIAILFVSDKNFALSLDEIKLGFEEGLNINEIVLILGKNNDITHSNREMYARYKEFFSGLIEEDRLDYVKRYLNVMLIEGSYEFPIESILYADKIDDLKVVAPIKKVSSKLRSEMLIHNIPIEGAYYFEINISNVNGENEKEFECISKDGRFKTKNEGMAQSWVCNKNNESISITKIRNIALKSR